MSGPRLINHLAMHILNFRVIPPSKYQNRELHSFVDKVILSVELIPSRWGWILPIGKGVLGVPVFIQYKFAGIQFPRRVRIRLNRIKKKFKPILILLFSSVRPPLSGGVSLSLGWESKGIPSWIGILLISERENSPSIFRLINSGLVTTLLFLWSWLSTSDSFTL